MRKIFDTLTTNDPNLTELIVEEENNEFFIHLLAKSSNDANTLEKTLRGLIGGYKMDNHLELHFNIKHQDGALLVTITGNINYALKIFDEQEIISKKLLQIILINSDVLAIRERCNKFYQAKVPANTVASNSVTKTDLKATLNTASVGASPAALMATSGSTIFSPPTAPVTMHPSHAQSTGLQSKQDTIDLMTVKGVPEMLSEMRATAKKNAAPLIRNIDEVLKKLMPNQQQEQAKQLLCELRGYIATYSGKDESLVYDNAYSHIRDTYLLTDYARRIELGYEPAIFPGEAKILPEILKRTEISSPRP